MRFFLFIFWLLISINGYCQVNSRHYKVGGYYRKNGTYVQPHYRTAPNSTNRDNFSTKPNTNPYTGKKGWIAPDNNPAYQGYTKQPSNSYNPTSISQQSIKVKSDYYNEIIKDSDYSNISSNNQNKIFLKNENGILSMYYVRSNEQKLHEKYLVYSIDDDYLGYFYVLSDGYILMYDRNGNYFDKIKK